MIETPGRFHSKATDHVVAGANEILDDELQKKQSVVNAENESFKDAQTELNEAQSEFNSEVREALGTGGTVDERIANAVNTEKDRAEGAEEALDGRIETLEEAVGEGGSVDERIADEGARHYTKDETYNKTELNNLITTPSQEYVSVTATDQTTSVIDVLPATGVADTIYRVGNWDGTQYNDSVFTEYAWNGSAYIELSTKSQIGEVYDISENHADTKYSDLAAALGVDGANIPQSLRKGGMSVKFVQSSDNKYVQARLMADSFTTDVTQWQGVDDKPKVGSKNLTESGGIDNSIRIEAKDLFADCLNNTYIKRDGETAPATNVVTTKFLEGLGGKKISIRTNSSSLYSVALYDANKTFIGNAGAKTLGNTLEQTIEIPVTAIYVRIFTFTIFDSIEVTYWAFVDKYLGREKYESDKVNFERVNLLSAENTKYAYIDNNGIEHTLTNQSCVLTDYIDIEVYGRLLKIKGKTGSNGLFGASYDENKVFLERLLANNTGDFNEEYYVKDSRAKYIRLQSYTDGQEFAAKLENIEFEKSYNLIGNIIPYIKLYYGYINKTGEYTPTNGFRTTDYIDVSFFKTWRLKYKSFDRSIVFGYDANYEFVRTYGTSGIAGLDLDEVIEFGDDIKYFRFFIAKEDIGMLYASHYANVFNPSSNVIIVSATDSNAKYTNLYDCLKNEAAGNKKIYLPDSEYVVEFSEQQPAKKLNIKEGWEIYGKGIDATTIRYTATSTSFSTNWLDVIGSCKMHDLTILNVYPSNMEVTNMGYCLHIDINVDGLRFECERVRCKVDPSNRIDPQTGEIDANPYGLALGLGTWYGQKFWFKDCIFETGVLHNRSGLVNLHNQPYTDKLPSETVFEGCYFGNAASSFHITDLARSIEQVKNGISLIGCTIKSFITFERSTSSKPRANSYNLNFSGTHFYGLTGFTQTVDPSIATYNRISLPASDQIDFIKNNSGSQITYGKFVKKTRSNISGTWAYDEPGIVVTGVGEAGVDDIIDGVSLVTIADGNMGHIINKGVVCINGYTIDSGVSVGDYVKLSTNSTIVKATQSTNVVYLGDNFIELL